MNKFKFLALCAAVSAAAALPAEGQNLSRADYLQRYRAIAVAHMEKYGIPASIKMAQGMHESGDGNSRLASEANNHFGIKADSRWSGPSIEHSDDRKDDRFRVYSTAEESWADHSEFLDKSERYQFLFELDPTDYKAWARGLRAAGYATDPQYPEKLIRIIEDNRLWLLDREEASDPGTVIVRRESEAPAVAISGEGHVDPDRYTIAMHHIEGRELRRTDDGLFVTAREGDTLHSISRLTGIRTGRLARLNRLDRDAELTHGQQIKIE